MDVDLKTVYDAIVVGSGAAGGMATYILANHGLKVLLLEAGKKQDLTKELHSMQWPYDHPRRGMHAAGLPCAEFQRVHISQAALCERQPYNHVYSYVQGWNGVRLFEEHRSRREGQPVLPAPITPGCARALLGGKTAIWGRLALRLSDYDFKAASRDGYGMDWPISYADIEPYYDKVDMLLGISGHKENLPYLPDGIFQRASRLKPAEMMLRESLQKSRTHSHAVSRGRDDRPIEAREVSDATVSGAARATGTSAGAISTRRLLLPRR